MQETTLIEQDQPVPAILSPVAAPAPSMTLCAYGTKLTREELARVATPAATATHKPIPHIAVVEKLIEALGFRQIGVVQEEYAVSADGMRMFGWLTKAVAANFSRITVRDTPDFDHLKSDPAFKAIIAGA
jgi:hypothetical protein